MRAHSHEKGLVPSWGTTLFVALVTTRTRRASPILDSQGEQRLWLNGVWRGCITSGLNVKTIPLAAVVPQGGCLPVLQLGVPSGRSGLHRV